MTDGIHEKRFEGGISGLPDDIFGEVIEDLYYHRGGINAVQTEQAWDRFYRARVAIGRETIFTAVRDAEAGLTIVANPLEPRPVFDPISQGI